MSGYYPNHVTVSGWDIPYISVYFLLHFWHNPLVVEQLVGFAIAFFWVPWSPKPYFRNHNCTKNRFYFHPESFNHSTESFKYQPRSMERPALLSPSQFSLMRRSFRSLSLFHIGATRMGHPLVQGVAQGLLSVGGKGRGFCQHYMMQVKTTSPSTESIFKGDWVWLQKGNVLTWINSLWSWAAFNLLSQTKRKELTVEIWIVNYFKCTAEDFSNIQYQLPVL